MLPGDKTTQAFIFIQARKFDKLGLRVTDIDPINQLSNWELCDN